MDEYAPRTAAFQPTQWTLVLAARGDSVEARAALSDLCAAYYAPVVAFLRRDGRDDDAAWAHRTGSGESFAAICWVR